MLFIRLLKRLCVVLIIELETRNIHLFQVIPMTGAENAAFCMVSITEF